MLIVSQTIFTSSTTNRKYWSDQLSAPLSRHFFQKKNHTHILKSSVESIVIPPNAFNSFKRRQSHQNLRSCFQWHNKSFNLSQFSMFSCQHILSFQKSRHMFKNHGTPSIQFSESFIKLCKSHFSPLIFFGVPWLFVRRFSMNEDLV